MSVYRRVWERTEEIILSFFAIKIGTDTISTAETLLKPYSGTFDDTYLSMEY
jgi:hypothetical protein